MENRCHTTAFISGDRNDNQILLLEQHNHIVKEFNNEIPFLRQDLTAKCLERNIHSTKCV